MGDGHEGEPKPKRDGGEPKGPLIGRRRSAEEITRSAEQSVEEYRRSEEVQDWIEEKRFDEETRNTQGFRDWARREPAAYEKWSKRRSRLAGEERQFLQERQTDKIASIRAKLAWEPHQPIFEENSNLVSLCTGLDTGLIGHFQTLMQLDSVPLRALDALRLDIRRSAHDMPLLLDRIFEPIGEVWGPGGRLDIPSPSISLKQGEFSPMQLEAIEPLISLLGWQERHFRMGMPMPGEYLLMAAYHSLGEAVDRYHSLVSLNAARDPAEAIKMLQGEFRMPDADTFKAVGEQVFEELKRTLTVQDIIWKAFEKSFGKAPQIMNLPLARYLEAGASVFLCGFGQEIGRQIANRFAEPRFSAVYDLLFEDGRVVNLQYNVNQYLSEALHNDSPGAAVDELRRRIKEMGKNKDFDGNETELALNAALKKISNLRSAIESFERFFGQASPEPQDLLPEALEVVFEVRRFRDLLSQSSRQFVDLEYLTLPLEALMEFCRLRMLDAANVDR